MNPIAKVILPHLLYQGSVMIGCLRRTPNVIEVTTNNGIRIGSLSGAPLDAAEGLAAALTSGGLQTNLTENIGPEIFRKLAFNNTGALSALHDMPLGGLLQPEFAESLKNIAVETWRASIDAGHRSFATEAEAVEDVFQRIRKAEKHVASITIALRSGRKTEIDNLCGAVVRISRANGWFATECARVWEAVVAVEQRSGAANAAHPDAELAGAA